MYFVLTLHDVVSGCIMRKTSNPLHQDQLSTDVWTELGGKGADSWTAGDRMQENKQPNN